MIKDRDIVGRWYPQRGKSTGIRFFTGNVVRVQLVVNNNNSYDIYWFIYQVSCTILVMALPITGIRTQTRTRSIWWSYIKDFYIKHQPEEKVQKCRRPDRPSPRHGQGTLAAPTYVREVCNATYSYRLQTNINILQLIRNNSQRKNNFLVGGATFTRLCFPENGRCLKFQN